MAAFNILDFLVVAKVNVADRTGIFVVPIQFVLFYRNLVYLFLSHPAPSVFVFLPSPPPYLDMQLGLIFNESLVELPSSCPFSAHLVDPRENYIPSPFDRP